MLAVAQGCVEKYEAGDVLVWMELVHEHPRLPGGLVGVKHRRGASAHHAGSSQPHPSNVTSSKPSHLTRFSRSSHLAR